MVAGRKVNLSKSAGGSLRDPDRFVGVERNPGGNAFPVGVGQFGYLAVRSPGPDVMGLRFEFSDRFDDRDSRSIESDVRRRDGSLWADREAIRSRTGLDFDA